MKRSVKTLTLTALFAAGGVVALYLGALLPNMNIALAAVAGLFTAAAVIEGGLGNGCVLYVAVSVLGLLVVPERTGPILFVTFFGYYPLVKSLVERRRRSVLGWAVKAAVFFVVLTVYLFVLREVLLGAIAPRYLQVIPLVYLVMGIVFVAYDIGLSKLIGFYLSRIYKYRDGR